MRNFPSEAYFKTRFEPLTARDVVWPIIADYIERRFLPEGGTILDLGAGYCSFINNLKRARERHALDISPVITKYAAPGVICHVQSGCELENLPADHFNAIFASHFFEHLERDETEQCLQGIMRILKPGGRLICLSPNFKYAFRSYFDDFTHKQILSHIGFSDLLRSFEFEIETCLPKFLPLSLKSRLPKHPLLVKLYLRSPFKPFAGSMLIVARKPR